MHASSRWIFSLLLCVCFVTLGFAQNFRATPLNDFQPGQRYLGTFEGSLYDGSNVVPPDHDADGRNFAAQVQPLDAQGHLSVRGKIVVVGIGLSNWTIELCSLNRSTCTFQSFLVQASRAPSVNHADLVLVDCAKGSETANRWVDDRFGNYTQCRQALARSGVTEAQVQVVLYKNAYPFPDQSLRSTTVCSASSEVDACKYERDVARTARFIKNRYPAVKQMFLQSRIYAGYAAPGTLNPEPFAYEYGFATKWLIAAQINQIRTHQIDPTAGDLSYNEAPWLAWGPYFWASGNIPRKDGLIWLPGDFIDDLTHPGESGVAKVSDMMLDFYLNSPYSPWFRSGGN